MPEYMIPMRIHPPLLKKQMQALMRAINNASVIDVELLEGIENLLYHIHDVIEPADANHS